MVNWSSMVPCPKFPTLCPLSVFGHIYLYPHRIIDRGGNMYSAILLVFVYLCTVCRLQCQLSTNITHQRLLYINMSSKQTLNQ